MKKICMSFLCFFIVSVLTYANDLTRRQLQQMYLEFLRGMNIYAVIDGDGDIEFEYEGSRFNKMTFWIVVDEEDQQFFRITKYNAYRLENEQDRIRAPLAAAIAISEGDAVKAYLNSRGDHVIFSAQVFLVRPEDFRHVFSKLMRQLDEVMYAFLLNL